MILNSNAPPALVAAILGPSPAVRVAILGPMHRLARNFTPFTPKAAIAAAAVKGNN